MYKPFNYITLDEIVRSIITKRGKSIHYYFKYLKMAADCARELGFDTIGLITRRTYTVTNEGNDTDGVFTVDPPKNTIFVLSTAGVPVSLNGCVDYEQSNCGKLLFKNVKEGSQLTVEYAVNASQGNASCEVPAEAQSTIEHYIIWKNSQNAEANASPEGRQYYNEYRILRARVSDLEMKHVIPGRTRNRK